MVEEKEARELLRRYIVEMNEKQTAENIHELLTDDFVWHRPGRDIVRVESFKNVFRKIDRPRYRRSNCCCTESKNRGRHSGNRQIRSRRLDSKRHWRNN
jgi:hypothetical protein